MRASSLATERLTSAKCTSYDGSLPPSHSDLSVAVIRGVIYFERVRSLRKMNVSLLFYTPLERTSKIEMKDTVDRP